MSARHAVRLLAVGTIASLALGWLVASAGAATGIVVANRVILFTANGPVTITKGGLVVTCDVTIGMQLEQSIDKAQMVPMARVQPSPASRFANCNFATGGVVLSDITVDVLSYTGTLPAMTSVVAYSSDFAILLQLPIIGSCLYTGTVVVRMNRNVGTGAIDTLALRTNTTLASTDAGCSATATLAGQLTVLPGKPIVQLI